MVGLGFMGATHLAAYKKIPGIEVSSISTQSGRTLAEHLSQAGGNLNRPPTEFDFSGVRQYNDWRELVRDLSNEVIDICLPTDLHAEVAIAALSAGKHAFCEKPMALSEADCNRMQTAAETHRRVLMIGHVLRFWPEYLVLADFVSGGRHGALRSLRFERRCGIPDWSGWLPLEARSGGAVLDLLVHDIDQAIVLFGMPESVAATGPTDIDAISARLSYRTGVEVRIEGGWLESGAPFHMGFHAQAEDATLELTADGLFLEGKAGRKKLEPPPGDAYDAEIGYFIECCKTGKPPDRCPPEQSAQAVALALLLKESRSRKGEALKC
jgi:predicted dehydrogenase